MTRQTYDIREAKASRLYGRFLIRFPVGWLYRWSGSKSCLVERGFPADLPGCNLLRSIYGRHRWEHVKRDDLAGFLRARGLTE